MAIFTGRRVRDNNVQGLISDNPLTAGATTLNSAGLGNMSAISGNHAVIVLDPLRVAGNPEIVIVTAHTASATSATITRGAYGTTARSHAQNVLWVAPAIDDDYVEILTANPADNYEGQLWYRSDTDIFMAHNGTSAVEALPIGAWQTYTPALTNWTLGAGTSTGRWTRIGRTVHVYGRVTFGAGATFVGVPFISLPIQGHASNESRFWARFRDNDGAGAYGFTEFDSNIAVIPFTVAGAVITSTTPFTWAASDSIRFSMHYEAAS